MAHTPSVNIAPALARTTAALLRPIEMHGCQAMTRTVAITATFALATSVLLFGAAGSAVADIPVGSGPTNYTEQAQPPPGTCHYRTAANGETLPDPTCTPGAINPKVTDATLADTICKTGYTKSIRPPRDIIAAEKRANAASYGYTGTFSDTEYDHLIPLELGGDPNDARNLWVEPGASPNAKDGIEHKLHQRVCAGTVSLAAAQQAIASDWTTALNTA
jgi:hypothetical protein